MSELKVPFPTPVPLVLENDHVVLSPVEALRDRDLLFEAASLASNGVDLFEFHVNTGPMTDLETFGSYLEMKLARTNELMFKVFSKRLGRHVGCVCLMNIQPLHGTVEAGSIWVSVAAQKSEVHTQTMLLLFAHVFEDLGYRRLEWKCNDRNSESKRAALRLGFQYEGLFRQHYVSRGENRDTAWYSLLDREWSDAKQRLIERAARVR